MPPGPKPPPYVICYLCGRKYGTKSIAIHEPACIKKWEAENAKLPKHLRRKMPNKPDYGMLVNGNYTGNAVDQMNEMAFQASQEQLIPCEHCGRTFFPERLSVHQRSCTAEKPASLRPKTVTKSRTVPAAVTSERETTKTEIKRTVGVNKSKNVVVKSKPRIAVTDDKYSGGETLPCGLCQCEIPIDELSSHLIQCNEEKTRHLRQSHSEREDTVSGIRKTNNRPGTRTLHRGKPKNNPEELKSAKIDNRTYDVDSEDEKPAYHPSKQKNNDLQVNFPTYDVDSNEDVHNTDLIECDICGRSFTTDRLSKHKSVCKKTSSKNRKVFDSSKHRLQGTEAAAFYRKNKSEKPAPKNNWRQKHQEFIRSIRAAKQVTAHMAKGGRASDLPPPPPSLNPDYVHCQYCDRRFNPEVAERHIPKCATTQNRPKPPRQRALDNYQPMKTKKQTSRASYNGQVQQNAISDPSRHNKSYSSNFDDYKATRQKNNHNTNVNRNMSSRSGVRTASRPYSSHHQNYNTSPRYDGYTSPRDMNNNSPMMQPKHKQMNRNSGFKPQVKSVPYQPKIFSGVDNKKPPARGYSYNAMNYTSPNFLGGY